MGHLPAGVAAVLAVLATGTYIICSENLTLDQAKVARIMCKSRASFTGAAAVVIDTDELLEVMAA